ncbi:MAG: LysR family transcriptional regulator [Pseudomonadota bacterium]
MSIRALRTLIAVQRHGSFRAAAEAEHLTASAVSHQMKNLEDAWGLVLFDRSLKSPVLTQTGLTLVGEATKLVSDYDNLAAKVSEGEELFGELILGAVPTTLTGLVPLGLSRLKVLHPGLRVRIVPGLSNQLLLQLERQQINAAIISRPEVLPPSLVFSEIMSEELVLLVSEGAADLPPNDLLGTLPFIRFTRDAVVGRQIEAWLQQRGIEVSDAMELEGLEAISSMVAAGLGVSIVPQSRFTESEHLRLKRISLEEDGPRRVIGLVSQASRPRARVVEAVKTAFSEAVI